MGNLSARFGSRDLIFEYSRLTFATSSLASSYLITWSMLFHSSLLFHTWQAYGIFNIYAIPLICYRSICIVTILKIRHTKCSCILLHHNNLYLIILDKIDSNIIIEDYKCNTTMYITFYYMIFD